MSFLALAKARCTTRGFTGEPIPADALNDILEAGRLAPTAYNMQPQRIIVVGSQKTLDKVEKAHRTFHAPCAMIVCRDRRNELVRPFDHKCSGDLDIGGICGHMVLAARERGLGSVLVSLFDPAIIQTEFDLPDYISPTALLFFGYPSNGFSSPDRHEAHRKPLGETVFFEAYSEPVQEGSTPGVPGPFHRS